MINFRQIIFDLFENLNCLTFIPVVSYNDAFSSKKTAILDNKAKSGIYCWTNLESNKSYIGSSVDLGRRLRDYFNTSFISHNTRKMMVINKALLKYGYSNFKLEILEYCDPKELTRKEQYYMDLLNPDYNVLNKAYSSLGYKHTESSLVKIHNHLQNLNLSKSVKVMVTNLETNISTEYDSLTKAAESLNTNRNTLKEYIHKSILYKGIYKLEANLSVSSYDSNYINHPASKKIEVIDLELNTVTIYPSIRAAARKLDLGYVSIATYLRRNQKSPYKGRYVFKNVL